MEFIRQSQDRAETRMARAKLRMDRDDEETRDLIKEAKKILRPLIADQPERRKENRQMRGKTDCAKGLRELDEESRNEIRPSRAESRRQNRELRKTLNDLSKTVDEFIKSMNGRPSHGHGHKS